MESASGKLAVSTLKNGKSQKTKLVRKSIVVLVEASRWQFEGSRRDFQYLDMAENGYYYWTALS